MLQVPLSQAIETRGDGRFGQAVNRAAWQADLAPQKEYARGWGGLSNVWCGQNSSIITAQLVRIVVRKTVFWGISGESVMRRCLPRPWRPRRAV